MQQVDISDIDVLFCYSSSFPAFGDLLTEFSYTLGHKLRLGAQVGECCTRRLVTYQWEGRLKRNLPPKRKWRRRCYSGSSQHSRLSFPHSGKPFVGVMARRAPRKQIGLQSAVHSLSAETTLVSLRTSDGSRACRPSPDKLIQPPPKGRSLLYHTRFYHSCLFLSLSLPLSAHPLLGFRSSQPTVAWYPMVRGSLLC